MRWTNIYLFRFLREKSNNRGELLFDDIIDFLKEEIIY